ncbi:cation-transporting P-type ATPase [Legionella pneumophila]|uniref:cation-transporting P-type ATPase n=1 Tax=Legionella pneumophila TaxID=446 RepID=UPI000486CB0A|nr:cation-transporting P-type ATPase [Legionella pneumophila]PYB42134.1 cation-transporting P-type ATPase [Legionella pneumophila]PYB54594.1 cation-transporting P-type ATPase [Legionella pneumophila]PYB63565.1 cation-transporting P-type ATPase [Legionella pneumophila]TID56640.1 cation-transporting P-type ATPase [Legionella pneumophila]TID56677.1 cation-transporting P-type ATPase [Legionella pneumophila]
MKQDNRLHSWYDCTDADMCNELITSIKEGLTITESQNRLLKFGYNELPSLPPRSVFKRLLSQLNNALILVLLAAAITTLFLGQITDSVIIFGVILINTLIGFIQEGKAEKAIAAVHGMLSLHATVLRENKRMIIPASELVVGDLVLLQSGDKIPADLKLVRTKNLKINEAILTGESNTVEKKIGVLASDTPLAEQTNMAFSGTLVTSGKGEGVVIATGVDTEIGKINQLLTQVQPLMTPLIKKMSSFSQWLSGFILAFAGFLFLIGYFLHHFSALDMFMASVGIIVAAIPEGLPVILTVALAIGVQRMASRYAIIRKLPAVETLGSVSIICTDKTGTLTRNEMSVQKICLTTNEMDVSGVGYNSNGSFHFEGKKIQPQEHHDLLTLATACVLCNDAELDFQDDEPKLQGDPMEGALLSLAAKAGLYRHQLEEQFTLKDVIPFDAEHRFMATLHHQENSAFIYLKGAPEGVFNFCSFQFHNQGHDAFDLDYWQQKTSNLAQQGLRTLAIAYKPASINHEKIEFADVTSGLVMIGLVGIIDPPREEAIHAVKECRAANIRVKMITGDHAITALAIARQLGIGDGQQVLTGNELYELNDERFEQLIETVDVFARTSPEDKLRLVKALQAKGYVVAMTGDGVNDAPALKRADIGVAMGHKGTEVAKEAAEMVITDDNFASIVAAVKEGRTVYDNLKKAILFLLPTNGGETLSLAIAIMTGTILPITPIQILWVNMTCSVALGLALAFEPSEPHIMKRAPISIHEPLLSKYLVWRIIFVSILFSACIFIVFYWALWHGESIEMARTMAVNTLVLLEIVYLFSSRYIHGPSLTWKGMQGTKPVLVAIGLVAFLQLNFTYMPFMQEIFKTESLNLWSNVGIGAIGIFSFIIIEFEKLTTLFKK